MSKEFTYSMPQSFLADKSVPIRWRIWAIINGFFIAGKEFWASNDWIAEQLNCHKDSVSQGVKELEDLGMMHSKRTRRSRVIYPGTGEIGANAYLRAATTPISDRSERLSISDSNSDKDTSELASEIRVVEVSSSEGTDGRPAGRLSKTEKEKLLPLIGWAERERGFNFLSTEKGKQLKALSLAKENGFKAAQLKERWEEMSVDKFWVKAGFDWYNVVQSFNKKGA